MWLPRTWHAKGDTHSITCYKHTPHVFINLALPTRVKATRVQWSRLATALERSWGYLHFTTLLLSALLLPLCCFAGLLAGPPFWISLLPYQNITTCPENSLGKLALPLLHRGVQIQKPQQRHQHQHQLRNDRSEKLPSRT